MISSIDMEITTSLRDDSIGMVSFFMSFMFISNLDYKPRSYKITKN